TVRTRTPACVAFRCCVLDILQENPIPLEAPGQLTGRSKGSKESVEAESMGSHSSTPRAMEIKKAASNVTDSKEPSVHSGEEPFRFLDLPAELRNEVYRLAFGTRKSVELFVTEPDNAENAESGALLDDKRALVVAFAKGNSCKKAYHPQALVCPSPLMYVSRQVSREAYDQYEMAIFGKDATSPRPGVVIRVRNWDFSAVLNFLKSLTPLKIQALKDGQVAVHLSLQITETRRFVRRNPLTLHPSFEQALALSKELSIPQLFGSYVLEKFYQPFMLLPKELQNWREDDSLLDLPLDPTCDKKAGRQIVEFQEAWISYLADEKGNFSIAELMSEESLHVNTCWRKMMLQFPRIDEVAEIPHYALPTFQSGEWLVCVACDRRLMHRREWDAFA
ncbi:hypothetical protein AC578_2728, partial [Pseudocercospora eumusae]